MAGGVVAAATGGAAGVAEGGGEPLGAGAAGTATTDGTGRIAAGGMASTGSAMEDGCDCACLAVVAIAAGGCTGTAFDAFEAVGETAGAGEVPSRTGKNASAINPANASDDIHADTRLSVLSTEAIVAMLTCRSIASRKLCVFPCRSLADERGENGIAS